MGRALPCFEGGMKYGYPIESTLRFADRPYATGKPMLLAQEMIPRDKGRRTRDEWCEVCGKRLNRANRSVKQTYRCERHEGM